MVLEAAGALLDRQAPEKIRKAVRKAIEAEEDNRISDIHKWPIESGRYAAAISLVSSHPKPPDHYKALIPAGIGLMHTTIETHPCA